MRHEIGKEAYIKDTVVRYGGTPVYIRESVGGKYLASPLNGGRELFIDKDDTRLDVTSPPVGYINRGDGTYYVQRVPSRQWKQGLCRDVAVFFPQLDKYAARPFEPREDCGATIHMISGEYPSFRDTFRIVIDHRRSYAFSQHFALHPNKEKGKDTLMLSYKNRTIGVISHKREVSLNEVYSYMAEMVALEVENV